jgi:hypothetical protein
MRTLKVDYRLSLKEMIRRNQFETMNYENITESNFPFPDELIGKEITLLCELFHFPDATKSVIAICKMAERNFRPATFAEILAFGQREAKVAGLGTYRTDSMSRRWTPIINTLECGTHVRTHLGEHNFDVKFDNDFYFLAVHK